MANPILNDLKHTFQNGSSSTRLMIINLGVFVLLQIIALIFFLSGTEIGQGTEDPIIDALVEWIGVPASLSELLYKPWTMITYMFVHVGLWHLLSNLIMLWFSSKLFIDYFGEKKLVPVYFLGGIAGALLYILAFNIFPVFKHQLLDSTAIGASASVFAILIAIAALVPNYSVNLILIGPVKLKYIAIVFLALDFINIRISNAGGHIAHFGGALLGYAFAMSFKRGRDFTAIFHSDKLKRKSGKMKVAYKRSISDEEYNQLKIERQKMVDEILDKISRSGYDSLTKEEKEFLFKMSNDEKSKPADRN